MKLNSKEIKLVFILVLFILIPIIIKDNKSLIYIYKDFLFKYKPINTKYNICYESQRNINNLIKDDFQNWTITVIDEKSNIINSVNSNHLKIPASNMKLISTAYTLNKYGPFHRFKTLLLKEESNQYALIGEGDPDLTLKDVNTLLSFIPNNTNINLYIYEVNRSNWWPIGWNYSDKLYNYGSPITSIAISSNENEYNPFSSNFTLSSIIVPELSKRNIKANIKLIDRSFSNNISTNSMVISLKYSMPLLSLLTLANAESHNFTSEVIFRNATNSWNDLTYRSLLSNWMKTLNISKSELKIYDASGLSRKNRISSKALALFLNRMKLNKYYPYYKSSLSIAGLRGTLSNSFLSQDITNNFYGKTGTLSDVFSLSGYLEKNNNIYSVSIISNNSQNSKYKAFMILNYILSSRKC
tara:strand:+ start:20139 stop:21377 length:1239 start_codon:yes stop_codon:yes gene_type:complete